MMLACLLFAFLFGRVATLDVSGEKHASIHIKENNKIRQYGSPFNIDVTLRNTYKSDLKVVSLHYIYSKQVNINWITANGKNKTLNSGLLLADTLSVNGTLDLTFNITLRDDPQMKSRSGYHIDNILIEVRWRNGTVSHTTGYNTILLPYVITGCDTLFDVKNNVLRRDQVTATSYYVTSSPQEFGPESRGWCADQKNNEYLEILFTRRARLTSIRTAARIDKENWMVKYKISYKKNGEWLSYKENGCIKLFKAYKDWDENKFPWFLHPLECDGIRIIPTEWGGELICARIEIKGCYISQEETCINAIGMEDGRIPNASLSARYQQDVGLNNSKPENGRLNSRNTIGWKGQELKEDWLQIDLGSLYKITRVAIQGGFNKKFYVTNFKLWYSNDSFIWNSIREGTDGVKTIFTETNENDVSLVSLEDPVIGRSFRIQPLAYETMKAFKTELYGCLIKQKTVEEITEKVKEFHYRTVLVDNTNGRIFICQRNLPKSNCYQSDQLSGFQKWTSFSSHIANILAVDSAGSSYARTIRGTYMIRKNNSVTWMDISSETSMNRNRLHEAVEIPAIIPNVESNTLRWRLEKGQEISVSGRGVHLRDKTPSNWKLIASWSCCGT